MLQALPLTGASPSGMGLMALCLAFWLQGIGPLRAGALLQLVSISALTLLGRKPTTPGRQEYSLLYPKAFLRLGCRWLPLPGSQGLRLAGSASRRSETFDYLCWDAQSNSTAGKPPSGGFPLDEKILSDMIIINRSTLLAGQAGPP